MKQHSKTLRHLSRQCRKPLNGLALFLASSLLISAFAKADCTIPDGQDKRIAQIQTLALQTHSARKMECAAKTALATAREAADNPELQAMALGVVAQTIDLLGSLKRADLMGVDNAMITRIHQLTKDATTLAEAALERSPDNADIHLMHAVILVLSSPWLEAEQSVKGMRRAIEKLEHLISTAPDTQGGLAQTVLGRIYFELPPMLGGDVIRSIGLLEDARQRNPDNVQTLRYLAESYDQELEEKKAVDSLRKMLSIKAQPGQYQLMADELRIGQGLALRLQARDVAAKLTAKRAALLKTHPELLTRASSAVGGHGGDNPLGEDR